eukprot:SAG31_NODE_4320_length_3361_cov_5.376150_4_plen_36_part_01
MAVGSCLCGLVVAPPACLAAPLRGGLRRLRAPAAAA